MAPKKDKRSHPWHDSYAEKYGLCVTSGDPKTGLVGSAICRICESFGREEVDHAADTATATTTKRKRKRTQTKRHYCKQFRSDNMSRHVMEQHTKKWAEYGEAKACSSRMSSSMKMMCCLENTMAAFIPVYESCNENADAISENKITGYTVTIKNAVQFDYVTSILSAGLSFQQNSKVITENRESLGTASTAGFLSPGEASCVSRIVCTVALDTISDLLTKAWSFSLACDVSTDDFGNSHLATRVRFPPVDPGTPLLSFHLLAISLFEESHSGESLFNLTSRVLGALCKDWRTKLIGSSTDGAANMTGYNVGLSTRLADDVEFKFYRVWCLAHQLELLIKVSMTDIFDRGMFPYIMTLI
jgi:hypothetical protein